MAVRIYFVISDAAVHLYEHKYLTRWWYKTDIPIDQYRIIQMCEYVIRSDEQGTRYIKNRHGNLNDEIDQEKFAWIKLSSVEIA